MAVNQQIRPIPPEKIDECFEWRDWLNALRQYVITLPTTKGNGGNQSATLGSMAVQEANNVDITGGTISNVTLSGLSVPYTALEKPPYGAFQSNATQTVATINTPTRVTFNTTDYANLTSFTPGDGIHVQAAGLYNVQFSVQVTNADTQSHDIDIWLRKGSGGGTAIDIPNTASVVSVQGTHGGQPGYIVFSANFFVSLAINDFIEFWWSTNSTQVTLNYLPAITTPFASPGAPSIVATLTYVSKL